MAEEHAVRKHLDASDPALGVLGTALLGDAELLFDLWLLQECLWFRLLLVDDFFVDIHDGLLKKLKQVEGAIGLLLRLGGLLLPLLNDWLIGLMQDELHLHHLPRLRQPAGKPVIAVPRELAPLLLHRLLLAIVAIVLVEDAALAGLLGLWVSSGPRSSFQLVDALGVELVGHSLPVALAQAPV